MTLHEAALLRYAQLPDWAQILVKVAIVVAAGLVLVQLVKKMLRWALAKERYLDATLERFLENLAGAVGYVFVAVTALGIAGVDVTALVGGLAVGGFIIGFALKDSLGNLAAGVMLLVYRPFSVSDVVELAGHTGVVTDLGISLTTLRRFDGTIVTVPNGSVLGEAIINFTTTPTRRIEVAVGIDYADDIDTAVRAILDMVQADDRILDDPAPAVVVTGFSESSVDLAVWVWVKNEDFGGVIGMLRREVKKALVAAGCNLPFPRRDVTIVERTAT